MSNLECIVLGFCIGFLLNVLVKAIAKRNRKDDGVYCEGQEY